MKNTYSIVVAEPLLLLLLETGLQLFQHYSPKLHWFLFIFARRGWSCCDDLPREHRAHGLAPPHRTVRIVFRMYVFIAGRLIMVARLTCTWCRLRKEALRTSRLVVIRHCPTDAINKHLAYPTRGVTSPGRHYEDGVACGQWGASLVFRIHSGFAIRPRNPCCMVHLVRYLYSSTNPAHCTNIYQRHGRLSVYLVFLSFIFVYHYWCNCFPPRSFVVGNFFLMRK